MPIMNYTTKVDVFATLGEIQGQLVKHGAKKIMQDYDNDGHITALSFLIDTPNGPRGVKLPANVDAVWNVLTKQKVKCDRDQAERVAWRIVKDWVAAQMAILESEMVQLDEIFLPYMLNDNGQTLFQCYRQNQLSIGGERCRAAHTEKSKSCQSWTDGTSLMTTFWERQKHIFGRSVKCSRGKNKDLFLLGD